MELERLDNFSRQVAEALFAKFPQWQAYATAEEAANGKAYLSVTVPAPAEASAAHGLTITTEDGVVTVGFDWYHSHFYPSVGDGEHFGTDYALHFIEELLDEHVAVISWWTGDQCQAFSTRQQGVNAMPKDLIGPYDRERIRSWKGSLNADRAA